MLSLPSASQQIGRAAGRASEYEAAHMPAAAVRWNNNTRDADAAGDMALAALTERAEAAGIEALDLSPRRCDFNEDLRAFGFRALRRTLRI
jgi:hypothetical protein